MEVLSFDPSLISSRPRKMVMSIKENSVHLEWVLQVIEPTLILSLIKVFSGLPFAMLKNRILVSKCLVMDKKTRIVQHDLMPADPSIKFEPISWSNPEFIFVAELPWMLEWSYFLLKKETDALPILINAHDTLKTWAFCVFKIPNDADSLGVRPIQSLDGEFNSTLQSSDAVAHFTDERIDRISFEIPKLGRFTLTVDEDIKTQSGYFI